MLGELLNFLYIPRTVWELKPDPFDNNRLARTILEFLAICLRNHGSERVTLVSEAKVFDSKW